MSNKVLITNSQKAVKVPSGLRILIRRACNAVLEQFFIVVSPSHSRCFTLMAACRASGRS